MPKAKASQPPYKGWKQFKMPDGSHKWLPSWANEPLNFPIPPDDALRQGAYAKPAKSWKKALKAKRAS
jgi:hypothetical protein